MHQPTVDELAKMFELGIISMSEAREILKDIWGTYLPQPVDFKKPIYPKTRGWNG